MATVTGSRRLLDISGNNISTAVSLEASGTLLDVNGAAGTSGQVLSSTGSGVDWITNTDDNYYLNGITKSGNTLTFSVLGATNQSYAFGSNAFTSTTIPTVSNATVTINTATGLDGATSFTLDQSANKIINLALDLNELPAGGTLIDTDSLVAVNGTANNKQVISSIPLSIFNNNSSWTSNTGTTTPSNTQTFTNKSGNISQWTNDSGYVTSSGMSTWILKEGNGTETSTVSNGETVTIAQGTGIQSELTSTSSGGTLTITNTAPNIVQTTVSGNAGSATVLQTARNIAGVSFNGSANISLNNNSITNGAGYTTNTGTTTPSNTQAFTNKSGNISQWTNDSGYITSSSIPSVGNGQIDGRTSGLGISGSMDATANQSGDTDFTVTSNAATAATASTIAYRTTSGDLNVRLLRANYANQSTISGAMAFRINNGTDNYTRYCSSSSAIRTWLGAGTGDSDLVIGTSATTAMAGNTTTITTAQAANIVTNNGKVGITTAQAANIVTNNGKVTDTGTPAILSNGSTPSLNSGISAAEVRSLIGAGSSSTTGTVTSVAASIDGDGLSLSGTPITTSGTLAFLWAGGSTDYINGEGDVTSFPTIPQGDITAVTAGSYLTGGGSSGAVTLDVDASNFTREVSKASAPVGGGWMTVAESNSSRHIGDVIVTDADSADHAYIKINWMRSYQDSNFTVLNCGGHANRITGARVLYETADTTYGWKKLQVYVTVSSNYTSRIMFDSYVSGWSSHSVVTPIIQNTISGYALHGAQLEELNDYSLASEEGILAGGDLKVNGGDIILGGTGRIQGVDTVSASTDAANKAYVDASVPSLTNYVTLNTAQTITGAKTFNNDVALNNTNLTGVDKLEANLVEVTGAATSNDTAQLIVASGGVDNNSIIHFSDDDGGQITAIGALEGNILTLASLNELVFKTGTSSILGNTNTKMTILSNGNTGIGTITPLEKLEVEGTVYATPVFYAANQNSYALKIGASNNTAFDMGIKVRSTSSGTPFMSLCSNTTENLITLRGNNVGIETDNPIFDLDVAGAIRIQNQNKLYFGSTGSIPQLEIYSNSGNNLIIDDVYNNSADVLFNINGNIGMGNTTPAAKLDIANITSTSSSGLLKLKSTSPFSSAQGHMIDFIRSNNTIRGFIGMNQYGVTYSTSSDYRLKRNIVPIADSIDRIKKLKPSRFNWDDGPDDYVVDGFIAHEVADVIPEAITGEKDDVDKDNAPIYQSIDQSKIVPLLTAALQEAVAKIEALELRINKLEKQ